MEPLLRLAHEVQTVRFQALAKNTPHMWPRFLAGTMKGIHVSYPTHRVPELEAHWFGMRGWGGRRRSVLITRSERNLPKGLYKKDTA